MFDKDFDFRGKHAVYVKFLRDEAKVFKRYIDVYMVSAVIGFLYGNPVERDTSSPDSASILASTFTTERQHCEFIYRLIMLLDQTSDLSDEERIDRAFRIDDSSPDSLKVNLDLFHGYVYGGVEVLYSKFVECTTRDDTMDKIYETVRAFEKETDGTSYADSIAELLAN